MLLILAISAFLPCVSPEECSKSFYAEDEKCTHEVFVGSIGWNTRAICNTTTIHNHNNNCPTNTTCGKHFRVSVFDQQLFAITMKNAFINMLTLCCEKCARCSVVNEIEDTMQLTSSILNSSDVIFPVLSESSVKKLHGFYFLDIYHAPSFYYFTLKKSSNKIIKEVIRACVDLWPFLLMCLLFASISGFIVWVIETRINREDFPRPFYTGMFDGFWWSFISMTTVGYGDKVTRSYLGKMYAVFWILIGITMCSTFTASLTSEIIQARTPASTEMAGKDIAVLKGRLHDIAVVADHGGILHIGKIGHTMRGINDMINRLDNGTVDGFLTDRNTYYHFSDRIKEPKYAYIKHKIDELNIVKTEKFHGQDLSCGMLVREMSDYEYFKGYFDNNRIDIRTCNSVSLNTKGVKLERDSSLFNSDNELFGTLVGYCVAVLVVTVVIGVVLEGRRYYVKVKTDV